MMRRRSSSYVMYPCTSPYGLHLDDREDKTICILTVHSRSNTTDIYLVCVLVRQTHTRTHVRACTTTYIYHISYIIYYIYIYIKNELSTTKFVILPLYNCKQLYTYTQYIHVIMESLVLYLGLRKETQTKTNNVGLLKEHKSLEIL